MSAPRIILVNGPPRSGKDTIGEIISDEFGTAIDKFAHALKNMTHRLYGLDRPADGYEDCKDLPHEDFLGVTPRKAYIAVSEKLMKHLHGERVFGQIMADSLERWVDYCNQRGVKNRTVVITDSGFRQEAEELIDRFGGNNVIVLRMHRNGCTFEGDSRDYVWLSRALYNIDIDNNGTKADLRKLVKSSPWISGFIQGEAAA